MAGPTTHLVVAVGEPPDGALKPGVGMLYIDKATGLPWFKSKNNDGTVKNMRLSG